MARKTRYESRHESVLSENLPIDVLPVSNGEHFPDEPTAWERNVMQLADAETERVRRNYGLSRRDFVRTSAAFTVGLWAMNAMSSGKYGYFAFGDETIPKVSTNPAWDANALNNPDAQLDNKNGEFIFDVQSHHIAADLYHWRALQPVHYAFICAFPFGLAGEFTSHHDAAKAAEADICEYSGRWHYLQDMFLDSSTTATVLSPVPSAPDEQNPLPFQECNKTADMVAGLASSMRTVTHGYVMPNRGTIREKDPTQVEQPLSAGNVYPGAGVAKLPASGPITGYPFLQDELDWMEERAMKYGHYLRGWKVYTPYGDVPFSSGMRHDDDAGMAMNEQIVKLNNKYGISRVLASHKGVPLPTFDNDSQHCEDVPGAAMAYPTIRFVIYHSAGGWKNKLYPTDESPPASDANIPTNDMAQGIIGLLKNLKVHGLDALSHIPAGLSHGNSPNVFVDIGSVYPSDPDKAALFLGTMIKHLGMRRICWGTDCIWSGSPQPTIVKLRALQFTQATKDLFNLPYGLDGDRFDPRVNALSGAQYTTTYRNSVTALNDAAHAGHYRGADGNRAEGFPVDGLPHPERSLRNGIFGMNAADAYEFDAYKQHNAIRADDVNKARQQYIGDKINGLASTGRYRTNIVYGPRTRQETIAMLNSDWKKNGWRA